MLLGSWCEVGPAKHVLDIGTGTGILSLMLAQRFEGVKITSVEIDTDTSVVAQMNVNNSPWRDRIDIVNADVRTLDIQVDHIICNPPYFVEQLQADTAKRRLARNGEGFTPGLLAEMCRRLLNGRGGMSFVYPVQHVERLILEMSKCGYSVTRSCAVRHHAGSRVTRVLLEFSEGLHSAVEDDLVLYEGDRRTSEFNALWEPFGTEGPSA